MEAIVAAIGNVDGKRRLRQRGDGVRKFYQQATVRRQNLSCEAPVPLDWTFLSEAGVIPAPTGIGASCPAAVCWLQGVYRIPTRSPGHLTEGARTPETPKLTPAALSDFPAAERPLFQLADRALGLNFGLDFQRCRRESRESKPGREGGAAAQHQLHLDCGAQSHSDVYFDSHPEAFLLLLPLNR